MRIVDRASEQPTDTAATQANMAKSVAIPPADPVLLSLIRGSSDRSFVAV
jgi:hypothetical protein